MNISARVWCGISGALIAVLICWLFGANLTMRGIDAGFTAIMALLFFVLGVLCPVFDEY